MTKILSADDSTSIRQMVEFTLKGAGFEIEQAEDGKKALEMALSGDYDLVLSDINMPHMDGIALVTELRKTEKYKYTPILLLTTESAKEMKVKGKEAGATGWIVKPFNPAQLIETVTRVLR